MKRAIIVRGNPGVGKTPVLIAIYQWLKAKYLPVIIHEELYYKDINDPTSGINDLFGVLQFGNLIVGIYSAGDEASAVKYYIDECKTKKCDIIVGACRRRRSTFDTIRAELPHTQYVTDWCHPEALSPILSVRIAAAILEIQTRLIGLPLCQPNYMNSSLTPQDITEFWIRAYLGASKDLIGAAIDRAYRDFNRTLHGYAKLKTVESPSRLKEVLRNIVSQAIKYDFANQHDYDDWHELSCDCIKNACNDATSYRMSYGQAQKWINMSLKYMAALGDEKVPGISKNYQWYHIPIDNIIQDILKKQITQLKLSWSRVDSYNDYLNYQKQFRTLHHGQIPLDVEFKLFNQIK